jgi:hypothetical protein
MSTPEEKLSTPSEHAAPARCTLEQLRARWGAIYGPGPDHSIPAPHLLGDGAAALLVRVGHVLTFVGMGEPERWRVEKIEGKRVDLVQEVET